MTDTFVHLPIGCSINHKILIIHGGVNTNSVWMTDVLEKLNRHREPDQSLDTYLYKSDPLSDFLWADPDDNNEEACFNESR